MELLTPGCATRITLTDEADTQTGQVFNGMGFNGTQTGIQFHNTTALGFDEKFTHQ
jgi:hypothetical protein